MACIIKEECVNKFNGDDYYLLCLYTQTALRCFLVAVNTTDHNMS